MTELPDGQVSLFDHDTWCGKIAPEPSAQTKEPTSRSSSKKRCASSSRKPPLFLYLKKDGRQQAASWVTDGASLGVFSTRNFGESPNVVVESRLSQILEENPHPKYCLTPVACKGILRRAERRGKELPKLLKEALLLQSESAADAPEGEKDL